MDWGEGIKDKSWRKIHTRMNSKIKATKDESESQKASKEREAGRTHQKPRYHIREEMQLKRVHWIWSDISSYSGVRTFKRQWEATAKPGCEQPRITGSWTALRHGGGKSSPMFTRRRAWTWGWTRELLLCKCGQKASDTLKSPPAEMINHRFIAAVFFFFSYITKRPKYQRRNGKWLNWHFRRRWWLLVQGAEATRAERQKSEDRTEAGKQRKVAAHITKKKIQAEAKGIRKWETGNVSGCHQRVRQENEIPGKNSLGMMKILQTKRHPNTSLKAQPLKKKNTKYNAISHS